MDNQRRQKWLNGQNIQNFMRSHVRLGSLIFLLVSVTLSVARPRRTELFVWDLETLTWQLCSGDNTNMQGVKIMSQIYAGSL